MRGHRGESRDTSRHAATAANSEFCLLKQHNFLRPVVAALGMLRRDHLNGFLGEPFLTPGVANVTICIITYRTLRA